MGESSRSIVRRVVLDAPRARVWQALTDPDDLGFWLCEQAFFRAEDGAPFRWEWGGGLHADGNVIAFDAPNRLQVTYRVPAFPVSLESPTKLAFEVESVESPSGATTSTTLTVTHTGFGVADEWTAFSRGHEESWDIDLAEFRELVEGRELEEVRRFEVAADPTTHAGILERVAASPIQQGNGLHATSRTAARTLHAFTTPASVIVTLAVSDERTIDDLVESTRTILQSLGTGEVQIGSPYG